MKTYIWEIWRSTAHNIVDVIRHEGRLVRFEYDRFGPSAETVVAGQPAGLYAVQGDETRAGLDGELIVVGSFDDARREIEARYPGLEVDWPASRVRPQG